ncbi:hypothetical protein [Rhodanobacter lindaniclasticus]
MKIALLLLPLALVACTPTPRRGHGGGESGKRRDGGIDRSHDDASHDEPRRLSLATQ